jgi:hypothetical protein
MFPTFSAEQLCYARNFFFTEVFWSPANARQDVFERVKKMSKDENELKCILMHTKGNPPPFSQSRYDYVRQEAHRISKNKDEMQKILKKTRFCTNKKCDGKETCQFAHSFEEYNPPTCLQQEFCLDYTCQKNHGFTKEEYVSYHDIKIPEKTVINLDKTQFCIFMTYSMPCMIKDCKFAHSLWEFRPMECLFKCKGNDCILFHKTDDIFSYMEKQKIKIKPWMLRSTEMNTLEELDRRKRLFFREVNEFIDEFRRLDQLGWVEEKEDEFIFKMANLFIDDEEEEEKKEDEDEDVEEEEDDLVVNLGFGFGKSFSSNVQNQIEDVMRIEVY